MCVHVCSCECPCELVCVRTSPAATCAMMCCSRCQQSPVRLCVHSYRHLPGWKPPQLVRISSALRVREHHSLSTPVLCVCFRFVAASPHLTVSPPANKPNKRGSKSVSDVSVAAAASPPVAMEREVINLDSQEAPTLVCVQCLYITSSDLPWLIKYSARVYLAARLWHLSPRNIAANRMQRPSRPCRQSRAWSWRVPQPHGPRSWLTCQYPTPLRFRALHR
jgi:hypothetical protein